MSGGQAVKTGRGERGITRFGREAKRTEKRGMPRVRPQGLALTAQGPQAPKAGGRKPPRKIRPQAPNKKTDLAALAPQPHAAALKPSHARGIVTGWPRRRFPLAGFTAARGAAH